MSFRKESGIVYDMSRFDEGDEDATLEISTRCGPVYDYSGQINADGAVGGLQCSAHQDTFCFLCAFAQYSEATDPGEEDAVVGIEHLITRLASDGHDIVNVVDAVARQYNKHIRPDVVYVDPITKVTTRCPRWERDAIQRHIIFSSRWPDLFHSIQTNTLRGILTVEASKLLDLDTGEIVEPNKNAYFKTVDKYGAWIKTLSVIQKHAQQAGHRHRHGVVDEYYQGPKIAKKGTTKGQKQCSRSRSRSRTPGTPMSGPPRRRGVSQSMTPAITPTVEI